MKMLVIGPMHQGAPSYVWGYHMKALAELGVDVVGFDLRKELVRFSNYLRNDKGKLHDPDLWDTQIAAERAYAVAFAREVDVVYVMSPSGFSPALAESLRANGKKVVVYFSEEPYEHRYMVPMAESYDYAFVNDKYSLPFYRVFNKNTHYLGHAYDPDIHKPGKLQRRSDRVVFIGTSWNNRQQFLEEVDWSGINLKLFGWWPEAKTLAPYTRHIGEHNLFTDVVPTRTARLYHGGYVGFNIHRAAMSGRADAAKSVDAEFATALNPRAFEMAACGLPHVSDYRPELDEVFGGTVPTFQSPEGLENLLRDLLKNPAKRDDLSRQQREAVMSHTFKARMRFLLETIT